MWCFYGTYVLFILSHFNVDLLFEIFYFFILISKIIFT